MTPGARVSAAIEILDLIAAEAAPADTVAGAYFRARRYIGGKDRPAIAALAYAVLRHRAQLDWWLARTREGAGRGPFAPDARQRVLTWLAIGERWEAERIAASFDGAKFRPPALGPREVSLVGALVGRTLDHPEQPDWVRFNLPQWLEAKLRQRFGADFNREAAALAQAAPLDLRINPLKTDRSAMLQRLAAVGLRVAPTPISPLGIRVEGRPTLGSLAEFQDGLIEVQDEGSQIAALLVDAKAGMRVCDFCAGAGGKTLALAAMMANKGHVVACDVSERRLEGATRRLRRAGVFNVERRNLSGERDPWVKRHAASFDRVLIDAPCTGAGTWRRNPDAKWTMTPDDLDQLIDLQRRILDSAARLVRPGGRLVYVTCSLLAEENERQAEWLLERMPEFIHVPVGEVWARTLDAPCPTAEPYLHLTPARNGTDGFFVAVFERSTTARQSISGETGADL
ncbi:MAG TPA: RsmB/NOP family class I SAM-dependent RNA methyltransferase [Alphaproteobacteria bacterium]|nr:RsmB/NOP family class I SAM-dependent RNA methyltransferase [Alphaproteobacteria bacterium]